MRCLLHAPPGGTAVAVRRWLHNVPVHSEPPEPARGSTLRQGKSCIAPCCSSPPTCPPLTPIMDRYIPASPSIIPPFSKDPPTQARERYGPDVRQYGHRWVPARSPVVCAACCRVLFAKVSWRAGRSEWAPGVGDRVPVVPSASLATALLLLLLLHAAHWRRTSRDCLLLPTSS